MIKHPGIVIVENDFPQLKQLCHLMATRMSCKISCYHNRCTKFPKFFIHSYSLDEFIYIDRNEIQAYRVATIVLSCMKAHRVRTEVKAGFTDSNGAFVSSISVIASSVTTVYTVSCL
ncbi:hypothetical protein LOAG_15248 [Loa loa]|uniref:Uncharacterized protein n=1 Tax=Loa loa TaxID=7209 RepID=A0A1S0TG35_LOALO|nr:hypothetical protein LOAG_15248 [Loa loa]EFO13282.1 hypothetical protein LOAG_15248 [Loa loa]